MTPLLPLDVFRAELGLHPWHFWGLADSRFVPINSKCSGLVLEYSWQGSDAAGRDDIRRALERAEEQLHTYLGYWPAPRYVETEQLAWPRYTVADEVRYLDRDVSGRRVAMSAPDGYIQAMGVEQLTLIGTANLSYSPTFADALYDRWTTAPLATDISDPDSIAVYFTASDRLYSDGPTARWRIEPVDVVISGGQVTISGNTWLMARPILYENPALQALDPMDTTNFVSAIEVYARTTNGNGTTVDDSQATLMYETTDCGGWGTGYCCDGTNGSTDPGTVGLVVARSGIRDSRRGLVTPAAAAYNSDTGVWSTGCCYAEPDRVRLRYLAGYPRENGAMAAQMRTMVVDLGAAELKRRICACRETNERLHDLQMDMALESTQTERYRRTETDLGNPFGTRLGHIRAWKRAKDLFLRRGTIA